MNIKKRNKLIKNLEKLSDQEQKLEVDYLMFFDGNDDESSIAPNRDLDSILLKDIFNCLKMLAIIPGVKSIKISILEWPDPETEEDDDFWVSGDQILIYGDMNHEKANDILQKIKPTCVNPTDTGLIAIWD